MPAWVAPWTVAPFCPDAPNLLAGLATANGQTIIAGAAAPALLVLNTSNVNTASASACGVLL